MSSILTNTSAMVALQTMRSINKNLADTQSQISTGKSVATARDNAAVWSISRTMESDVKGFKAISSSLALGSSTVGVARQAAETVTDLLTQMKGRIVAAQEENVDRGKIQTDIVALREQIQSVVGAAQFNGLNLLDGSSDTDVNVLSSLDRSATGTVAPGTIQVARQNLSVNTPANGQEFGETALAGGDVPAAFISGVTATETGGAAGPASMAATLTAGDTTVAANTAAPAITIGQVRAGISFEIVLGGLSINTPDGGTAIGDRAFQYVASDSDGTADVARNLTSQLNAFFGAATGNRYSASINADGQIVINNASDADMSLGLRASDGGTAGATAESGGLGAVNNFEVTTTTGANQALAAIEGLIQQSISAAAAFGSAQTRIDTQAEFVKNLTDSLTTGIGSLVDADLEATSARLQALQVQQQLATQSLSIANQQPQNILALFR